MYVSHFIVGLFLLGACSPTPMTDGVPNDPLSPVGVTNPIDGPVASPTVAPCTGGQIPATTGGCVSLTNVNQFNFANTYSFIGFTRYQSGGAVLLERSAGAFNIWDLYLLPDSGSAGTRMVPLCSMTKLGAISDSFGGLNYSSAAFHTLANQISSLTRVYDISDSTCKVTAGPIVQSGFGNCGYLTNYLLFDGMAYIYSFNCSVYKTSSNNSLRLAFDVHFTTGESDDPTRSASLTFGFNSEIWFLAANAPRVWHTNSFLKTDAWFELPINIYPDLFNGAGLTWDSANHLHVLTFTNQNKITDYNFDLANFWKAALW